MQVDGEIGAGQEGTRGVACLLLTFRCSGEHDIADLQFRLGARQAEQGSACADLNVIRVSADDEYGQGPAGGCSQMKRQHADRTSRR